MNDHLTPSDIKAAYQPPSYAACTWNGGAHHSHFHLCPACSQSWDCDVDGCRFPVRATCLQCWCAVAQREALPGPAVVVVSLAAGLLILVAFAMAVLW